MPLRAIPLIKDGILKQHQRKEERPSPSQGRESPTYSLTQLVLVRHRGGNYSCLQDRPLPTYYPIMGNNQLWIMKPATTSLERSLLFIIDRHNRKKERPGLCPHLVGNQSELAGSPQLFGFTGVDSISGQTGGKIESLNSDQGYPDREKVLTLGRN